MTYEESRFWNELLTLSEAAEDLKVSTRMVEKWKAREWNPLKLDGEGKNQRITRGDLREWFKKYSAAYPNKV
jgi:hypothetical protein